MKRSIGTILSQLKQYKTAAILTPVFTTLVVVMDVFIPYVTASLIDKGINASDMWKCLEIWRNHDPDVLRWTPVRHSVGFLRGIFILGPGDESKGSNVLQHPEVRIFRHR
jgi:ABC-type multidrug transport system fused ATPase/permease subunit